MSFDALGLTPELLRAVADQGYTEPTPVQREAIPLVLAGRDILAGAQTGTGKTAAFVLPMLQLLNAERTPGWKPNGAPEPGRAHAQPAPDPRATAHPHSPIRALILTPTRELALQVEESVRTYGAHRRIRSVAIYGGVGYEPQIRALRAGPGDRRRHAGPPARPHRASAHIDLSKLEILVLDEADRMLDMGFIRDIRKVIALLPRERQNLLFSATFSDEIRQLAGGILRDPAMVQVTPRNSAAALVTQIVHPVDRERKRELLSRAHPERPDRAGARLHPHQARREPPRRAARHATGSAPPRSTATRARASASGRSTTSRPAGRAILVATEVASRGLDIEDLPHVVNYELPMVPEDYVHRIGRTGRAGATGDAISLVCVDEAPLLREIEKLLGRRDPDRGHRGLRARSLDPRGADPPALGRTAVHESFARRRSAPDPVRSSRRSIRPSRPRPDRHQPRPDPPVVRRPGSQPGTASRRPSSRRAGLRDQSRRRHPRPAPPLEQQRRPATRPARPASPGSGRCRHRQWRRSAPELGRGAVRPWSRRPRPRFERRPRSGPGWRQRRAPRFDQLPGERLARSNRPG